MYGFVLNPDMNSVQSSHKKSSDSRDMHRVLPGEVQKCLFSSQFNLQLWDFLMVFLSSPNSAQLFKIGQDQLLPPNWQFTSSKSIHYCTHFSSFQHFYILLLLFLSNWETKTFANLLHITH